MTHAAAQAVNPSAAIPSLDGIRAIAVALVFFAHNGFDKIVPGGLGVTVFFVLSGYLISTLLRMEFATTQKVDYRGFYLRRFLRLMPPLAIVVAIAGILTLCSVIDGAFTTNGLLSVLFYYGNYFVIAHDFNGLPAGLGVVWSLAVEEHFYFLYPPLALVLLRTGRRGISAMTLLTLCALILGWRCWLALHGASEARLTMATDTRVDAILIGCLMALWRNPWLDVQRTTNARSAIPLIAMCVATLLFTLVYRDEFFRLTFRHSLQALAIAPLIYFAVVHAKHAAFSWLNAQPLIYIGTISYTVYLSHHIILLMVDKHFPQLSRLVAILVTTLITLAFAEAMRRWIEAPCARLRKRLHKHQQTTRTANSAVIPPRAFRGTL